MIWARSSISPMIGLARSGMAPSATAKNTANTTICRISFCAIASAIEVGIRCVRNFSIENADTGRPVDCALSGSVPGKLAPGCSRFTMTRPSSSETKEALTNQPMVLAKMRPSLAPEPIWAMPPTRVANTSGAFDTAVGHIVEDHRADHDTKHHRNQDVLRKPVRHLLDPRKTLVLSSVA